MMEKNKISLLKVEEPEGDWDVWECYRCKQSYCGECVETHEVKFDINDAPEGHNQEKINWKGERVCPWCYNQLIDLKEKEDNVETELNLINK